MFKRPSRRSIVYFIMLLAILFFVLLLPSFLPVQSEAQKQANMNHNNQAAKVATANGIFSNNMLIATLAIIPGIGWGFILFSMWETGLIVASYSQPFYVLLSPVAWIELSVYAFAIISSVELVQIYRHKSKRNFFQTMLVSLAMISIILFLSATFEIHLINGGWV